MLHLFISIIGVLVTILLVVGVHEFGHFIVAKLSGIKVLRFSIGFGKALCSWHDKSGTEYVIAAIPLGGYIKMLDEEEETVSEQDKHLAFNRQPIYKKFAVIAAGPFFNLLFAFIIYWFLFVVGFTSVAPIIGNVTPGSIAEKSGLHSQQEILRVDTKYTNSWMSIIVNMLSRAGDKGMLQVEAKNLNDNNTKTYELNLANWHMDNLRPDPLLSLGIIAFEPVIPNVIGKIIPDSPAVLAGLKPGDQIIAVNNLKTVDWLGVVEKFVNHPGDNVLFTIIRNKQVLHLTVTIGTKHTLFFNKHAFVGMAPAFEWPKNLLRTNKYMPLDAAIHAWADVKLFTDMNMIVFGKILTGKISLESLGGPITIFESAGSALNNGIMPFLSFLAFLSISIGVINIIPIPGLDGGHLLFQVIEFIFQRPLAERAQILLFRFGLIALFLLMMQALVNDILRL